MLKQQNMYEFFICDDFYPFYNFRSGDNEYLLVLQLYVSCVCDCDDETSGAPWNTSSYCELCSPLPQHQHFHGIATDRKNK